MMTTTKTTTMYSVRYYTGNRYSKHVGSKMRLVEGKQATRIVRRLRNHGIDAFRAPVKVTRCAG
jgi:hypothetical protein